jgi:AcrR family transcriptional regulator
MIVRVRVEKPETAVVAKSKPKQKPKRGARARKYDPDETKRDILSVATAEFARHGYNGARIDAIAARTSTTKRMIYYYFGGKERLYITVLEQEYAKIRTYEEGLGLESLEPEQAIRRLTEFTFDYDHAHPDFVRLVAIENIHHARHLAKSTAIRSVNATIIGTIDAILQRGRLKGDFKASVRAVDVHMLMSALCFFHVSNLHTFGAIFRRDFLSPSVRKTHKKMVADFVVHLLKKG